MSGFVTKRRVIYLSIAVVAVLAILSFVLPYVGAGHSKLTPIP